MPQLEAFYEADFLEPNRAGLKYLLDTSPFQCPPSDRFLGKAQGEIPSVGNVVPKPLGCPRVGGEMGMDSQE